MYHIAHDTRTRQSAQRIADGLLACLNTKEFSRITVTDVWKASGVSRATFYRLFDNTSDVLAYQCDRLCASLVEAFLAMPAQKKSARAMGSVIFHTIVDHYQLLEAVIRAGRIDIAYKTLMDNNGMLRRLYAVDEHAGAVPDKYFLNCVCLMVFALVDDWIGEGRKRSADELYDEFRSAIGSLSDAFCAR